MFESSKHAGEPTVRLLATSHLHNRLVPLCLIETSVMFSYLRCGECNDKVKVMLSLVRVAWGYWRDRKGVGGE